MSRRDWRCRNPDCPAQHGALLGILGASGDLELAAEIAAFAVYLDTRKAVVVCPACGARREFRAGSIHGARDRSGVGGR